MKTLIIERGDKKFDYQIHQLKAWDWVNLLFEVGQSFTDTPSFKAKNIMAALNSIAGTGATNKEVTNDNLAKTITSLQSGSLETIIDLAISAINGLNESRRIAIISKALSCVYFNNGNPAMGGGMIQLNADNVDLYITHPIDVLTLTKEALQANYQHVFADFFKEAPSTK